MGTALGKYELDKVLTDGSVILKHRVPAALKGSQKDDVKVVWMSEKQIDFCRATQKMKVMVAGRGFGKSAMLALQFIIWMLELPRGKAFLAAINLVQVKNETLAVIQDLWGLMGFQKDIDYVVGEAPPKEWTKFKAAWYPPEDYSNCVTFKNGFTIVLVSSIQIKTKRGGNYDCGVVDEAAFVDEKVFDSVLSKATRANPFRFKSPYHHQKVLVTSRPRDIKGQWVSDFEQKQEAAPDRVKYEEASARDNPYLTEEWFENEMASSGYLEFLIEVENEKIDRLPDGFYHQWSDGRNAYADEPIWIGGKRFGSRYNPKALLDLSFDFGGYFSCCSVFQESEKVEWLQKQFYVDVTERINELVDKITAHYSEHEFKFVRLWGEPYGNNLNPARMENLYEQISERFLQKGWSVKIKVGGQKAPGHKERYEYINNILAEDNPAYPKLRVSSVDAKDIITAIKLCDRTGDFQKNKQAEKNKRSPQLHAPHFTDTVDYYFVQKYGMKKSSRRRRAMRA